MRHHAPMNVVVMVTVALNRCVPASLAGRAQTALAVSLRCMPRLPVVCGIARADRPFLQALVQLAQRGLRKDPLLTYTQPWWSALELEPVITAQENACVELATLARRAKSVSGFLIACDST